MLEIKDLEKHFGDVEALAGLNLEIQKGALYGLVGQNGAGKTTAMKIMTGLLSFWKGSVLVDGIDIKKDLRRVKSKIGYVPDDFGVYDNLTVYEYMEFFAEAYNLSGLNGRKRILTLLEQVDLSSKEDFLVDSLSRGMQQRLSLARALLHDPIFLVMDDPTSGMDPRSRYSFKEMMRQLQDSGKTILLSSHILGELPDLCTDIGIIDKGKLLVKGKIGEIMDGIEKSNPLEIRILQGESVAIDIFKKNPYVSSISYKGRSFMLGFQGSKTEESALLYELISNEVPVVSFVRETGSLESFFMQMTSKNKERVISKNDY